MIIIHDIIIIQEDLLEEDDLIDLLHLKQTNNHHINLINYTQLPNCLVCLQRLDYTTSGLLTLCNHTTNCNCFSKSNHSCQVCKYLNKINQSTNTCNECGVSSNLWICLICGFVGCGRYEKGFL